MPAAAPFTAVTMGIGSSRSCVIKRIVDALQPAAGVRKAVRVHVAPGAQVRARTERPAFAREDQRPGAGAPGLAARSQPPQNACQLLG